MRALLIEDDATIADFVGRGLREAGFAVDHAADGVAGLTFALQQAYDVAIIDVMLPKRDGLSVIDELRHKGVATPVLILSARRSVDDRVRGLQAGGDDYLTKPFAFAELLARIRALLRRARVARPPILRVTDLTLDPASRRVTRAGVKIGLTSKEYTILEVLMQNAGETVSRTRLVERVWDEASEVLDNLVDVHVSHLRKKIDRTPGPSLIQTVRGFGYRLGVPESAEV